MPLPKAFTFAGNQFKSDSKSAVCTLAGCMGACLIIIGFVLDTPLQIYYVLGAALLLITAIYYKLTYFIALELIVIAGHGAIFFGIGPVLQVVIPILLSFQLLVYYLLSGELQTIYRLIGIAGIALLSIGFSYTNFWVFLFGNLFVATFAYYSVYKGKRIALIWAILNTILVIDIFLKLIF